MLILGGIATVGLVSWFIIKDVPRDAESTPNSFRLKPWDDEVEGLA